METTTEEIKSIISENLLPKEEEQLNHLNNIENQTKKIDTIETQENEILKKIDIMEANLIKKNKETLNKIENLVQNLTSNLNERQNPPLRRTNNFDDVKQLMKPINNNKRRKRKPKAKKKLA
jgi:hypothetical protein